MTKRTAELKDEHNKLGAAFTEWNNIDVVEGYSSVNEEEEVDAVRDAAGMFDLTGLRKIWVKGPDARDVLNKTCSREIGNLKKGKSTYTLVLTDDGTICDDAIIYGIEDDKFLFVHGTGTGGDRLLKAAEGKDMTAQWDNDLHTISVQGPKAVDILDPNADGDIAGMKFFEVITTNLFGREVILSRTGYSGEKGYEIFCERADAVHLWQNLLEAGKPEGLKPCSFTGLDKVRVEAGLLFYPYDANENVTPWEAGLGFAVSKKKSEFLGRDAALSKEGKENIMVRGIACKSDDPVIEAETELYQDGKKVGDVISPSYSRRLGKSIAIVHVQPDVTEGATLTLGNGSDAREVTVENLPFYDKEKLRPRA